jgi:uncharacterized membrane protein YoaK (UPF0700 family)
VVAGLLTALAVASGAIDAFCVINLGGAFASVITGNLVNLGRAIATLHPQIGESVAVAVIGYGTGVGLGAIPLRARAGAWTPATSVITGIESALLAVVAVGWWGTGGHPGHEVSLLLLLAAAMAMGTQSSIAQSTGIEGASTTYLTGTLTRAVRAISRPRANLPTREVRQLGAFLGGALAGTLLVQVMPTLAPLLPLGVVVIVAAIGAFATREAAP